jgi:hypothetical protein
MAVTKVADRQVVESIDLTAEVANVLPMANGGTGVSAAGTTGFVLTSTGSAWASKADAPNVTSTASSATPSLTACGNDQLNITALAVNLTGITVTGPAAGYKLIVRVKDNGTSRTFAPGTQFQSSDNAAMISSTTVGKTHIMGFIYDEVAAKYVCVAVNSY